MIAVQVRYAGLPRSERGKGQEIWQLPEGTTLERLLTDISSRYGWPLQDDSRFIVVHNNHGISREGWSRKILRDGDLVLIISSIMGG